jgi:diguanylate cyclase (GGDEF)-like protein
MLDIDHFKQVNDTYGHAVGDQVLRAVARRCRESLRGIDLLGRYGGEEFAALLPEDELAGARRAAERLRQHIANAPVDTERGLLNITISLGAAAVSEGCPDLTALLDRADAAMYAAKKAGRNRVETLT